MKPGRYLFSLSYISLELRCRFSISTLVFALMLSSSSFSFFSYSDLYWSLFAREKDVKVKVECKNRTTVRGLGV